VRPGRLTLLFVFTSGVAACAAGEVAAQAADLRREIRQSEERLEQIRAERERLEREMRDARNRIQDVSSELANVERRLSASRSVLAEVQFQSDATADEILRTQSELLQAQDRLAANQAVLLRRLRDIYKMGPLQTAQVLLGARSFMDLLNRYRYLQRIASFDRSLVDRVEELEGYLARQNRDLQDRMSMLGSLRLERLSEVAELQAVETERQTALRQYRAREQSTVSRLGELEADEQRLTSVIDDLETRRRELEARARGEGPSLTSGDVGSLDWPLEGEIIYRFGRERQPNGTILRWNGIGIRAAPGDPVRAVRAGHPRRTLRGLRSHRRHQPRGRLLHALPLLAGDRRGRGSEGRGRAGRGHRRGRRHAGGSPHRVPDPRAHGRPLPPGPGPTPLAPSPRASLSLHPIVGHERTRSALAGALARGTLPSALLIRGPKGVGKQRLALWLAQLLVCEAPSPDGPCDRCGPCRMTRGLEHPDVHWYFPLERPKRVSGDRLADALEDARLQALAELRSDGLRASHAAEVRGLYLGTARNIRARAAKRPTMAPGPVFIVGDAEHLVPQEASQEAANALLKLLEEPPGDARFLLTSSEPGLLLPTIVSRTVPVQVGGLPEDAVAAFLVEHRDVDPERAAWAARLGRGAIGRALGFLDTGDEERGPLEELRRRAFDLTAAAVAPDVGTGYRAALSYPPAGARSLIDLFAFVEEWVRDLAAVAAGADDLVLNHDARDELRRLVRAREVEAVDVPTAFSTIEGARELARGNVNPQLVVNGLVRDLRHALAPRGTVASTR